MTNNQSPNGGPTIERRRLSKRFSPCLSVNNNLNRKLVSYQGNRDVPGFRWLKYKEGFSRQLVADFLKENNSENVLDPFAGIGTTPLVATSFGKTGTGIEIMPVGILLGNAVAEASNSLCPDEFRLVGKKMVQCIRGCHCAPEDFAFPHVRITEHAFPRETEEDIATARSFLANVDGQANRALLELACISVLEDTSYTRKDGQYLRWDSRSGRPLRSGVHKGEIPRFSDALEHRIAEMLEDIEPLKAEYGKGRPDLRIGSCLELLRQFKTASFDMVITSPPYANRYDYTRTYALELAWMGYDQNGFSKLRQSMLSATVENKVKIDWLEKQYDGAPEILAHAIKIHSSQSALHEVLSILRYHEGELSNRQIIRLVDSYFLEMAVVITELGRVVRPGGYVFMVNDNVQYHGEELPVDFILSDFAEQSGFDCEAIWSLPRGKGNSSQQMARYGRKELRKCVYRWKRSYD